MDDFFVEDEAEAEGASASVVTPVTDPSVGSALEEDFFFEEEPPLAGVRGSTCRCYSGTLP